MLFSMQFMWGKSMSVKSQIEQGKLLKNYTTLKVGGPAREFITVNSTQMMLDVMQYIKSEGLPFMVLGKGSNCLFDDRGFDGLIILNKIDFIRENGAEFEVGSGFSYSLLGVRAARKRWSGLEFASGIPGTVGGAVYMNAGANGMETCDALSHVSYIDEEGKLVTRTKEELTFRYRYSSFHEMKAMIVSAGFTLSPSEEARKKQIEIVNDRTKTQPYGECSAGCIFRNPAEGSAGALIEKSELKGLKIGGAEVSLKHGNFIINTGNAKTSEILELIALVKSKVKTETGTDLKVEVKVIPYE